MSSKINSSTSHWNEIEICKEKKSRGERSRRIMKGKLNFPRNRARNNKGNDNKFQNHVFIQMDFLLFQIFVA